MNKLLKSVRTSNHKNDLVKKSITAQLSNSVKELQYASVEDNKEDVAVDVGEAATTLCTAIEAMFLHGLKDSLSGRFKRALADFDARPEVNFWAPLLVISHRQIIDQITNLSQITTEVGQCRAWVRLALNDCLLSSYLCTMRQDSSALKSFYHPESFVRDSELLDVVQSLIEGVEAIKQFTLPCNSSLLNTWSLPSLLMAGVWAPTLKSCPVAPCDDVAQAINETSPRNIPSSSDNVSLCSAMSLTSQNSSLRQIVALNENEVLKIILAKDKTKVAEPPDSLVSSTPEEIPPTSYPVGNSLNNKSGWSFDEEAAASEPILVENPPPARKISESKSMEASFNALIESYNMLSGDFIKTPDIREIVQKYNDEIQGSDPFPVNNNTRALPPNYLTRSESTNTCLSTQIGWIPREKGLDKQNYECAGCKQPLDGIQNSLLCHFTGELFCEDCMNGEDMAIPARIVHNWDFKTYPVSKKAFNFLEDIKGDPVIDFKVLNPLIYGVVQEMARLQVLRNQLNFLRGYLYTCREPIIQELKGMMYPMDYKFEHIHQYSISDLNEVKSGALEHQLGNVVAFGKTHVASCWLCSQKGFVCEVCNKSKVLFPFDVEHVFRCEGCNGVYHKECLNSTKPCPKCDRRKKREDVTLLGAITSD